MLNRDELTGYQGWLTSKTMNVVSAALRIALPYR